MADMIRICTLTLAFTSVVKMDDRGILWCLLISVVFVNHVRAQDGSVCTGSRCGECTIKAPQCTWCKDNNFSAKRCGTKTELTNAGCMNIVERKISRVEYIQNDPLTDGGVNTEPVQIRPQHVKVYLVPNEPENFFNFSIEYKVAKNFPLDLYFLNDPSFTMRNLKAQLVNLAQDISQAIESLTTDYQFGLGTSMDKVALPFTRTAPEYLKDPCYKTNEAGNCAAPYSFIHWLSLNRNINEFIKAVEGVNLTANLDKPEGLLDGLMQVMVCGDQIGWRNKSRRMLIFATDTNFHQAGDGRLAGILEPNDGLCHLDANMKYSRAETQDYPSVGQIIQKAKDNNINVIFTIGGENSNTAAGVRRLYYDNFASLLPGGTQTAAELTPDAKNILTIVSENYRRLRETVILLIKDLNVDEISVILLSACYSRTLDRVNMCTDLTLELAVEFFTVINANLTSCPEDRSTTFYIEPDGLQERVTVDVEYVCDCDCQLPPEAEENSMMCNYGNGTFECGICHCNEGWTGAKCDCDNRKTEEEACGIRMDNTTVRICSNAGNCTCGKCLCEPGYSGKYCECYNLGCEFSNKTLCGGNGECVCGTCVCNEGYTGSACECPISTDLCQDNNGTLCSGQGSCNCGRCECNEGYRGETCQTCITCEGVCSANRACAECVGFKQGKLYENKCASCGHVVAVSTLQSSASNANVSLCQHLDEENCLIRFTYEYTYNAELVINVLNRKECQPPPPEALTLGLSISGAIFAVGFLLLIIWKLLTMLYDSMEFSRFEVEIKNPAWDRQENPIYKDCVTKYQNPVHETGFNQNGMEKME